MQQEFYVRCNRVKGIVCRRESSPSPLKSDKIQKSSSQKFLKLKCTFQENGTTTNVQRSKKRLSSDFGHNKYIAVNFNTLPITVRQFVIQ